ncbi:hypothetical protein N0V93_005211 [Gnomoniopsis smithogilvyi]|uniref:DRBM domain-containing protein n=1 Tax=Gnomoniopsis smithogilvyi TaxID=1191159 RepID=A0A9W9CWI9_9PEZI|nr:hypothetical protein N0V93_005211 [Gnomoniopsis smithogilvyi]
MALPAELGSMPSAAIYQGLKAWIAQQEAYEAQHNKPAPLTGVQHLALQAWRLPSANPSPPPPTPPPTTAAIVAPELNYIGLLMEYHQKHNYLDRLHYVEEASGTLSDGVTGRISRVTIAESFDQRIGHIEHFPTMGYGLNADGTEPRFPSKKAAKRFAAKCAVQWLAAQGLMPSDLQAFSPPFKAQNFQLPNHTSTGVIQNTDSTDPPPPEPQVETVPPRIYGPPGAAIAQFPEVRTGRDRTENTQR